MSRPDPDSAAARPGQIARLHTTRPASVIPCQYKALISASRLPVPPSGSAAARRFGVYKHARDLYSSSHFKTAAPPRHGPLGQIAGPGPPEFPMGCVSGPFRRLGSGLWPPPGRSRRIAWQGHGVGNKLNKERVQGRAAFLRDRGGRLAPIAVGTALSNRVGGPGPVAGGCGRVGRAGPTSDFCVERVSFQ